MKFLFDDVHAGSYKPHEYEGYAKEVHPEQILEALQDYRVCESDQENYHVTWLEPFGGLLALKQTLLLGIEHGNNKLLRLYLAESSGLFKLLAEQSWRKKVWPKFYWHVDDTCLRNALKNQIKYWSLIPRQQFTVSSRRFAIRDSRDKTVARLILATVDGEGIPPFCQFKLISLRGYEKKFDHIQALLEPWFFLKSYPATELLQQELFNKECVAKRPIDAKQPVLQALQAMLQEALDGLTIHYQGTLDDIDTEFLHQYRVNVRKTRSLLKEFKKLLPVAEAKRFAGFFKTLNNITAPVRDLDVYLLKVEDWTEERGQTFRDQIKPFEQLLKRKRRVALRSMLDYLTSESYQQELTAWKLFLDELGQTETSDQQTVQVFAANLIAKCYKRLLKEGGGLTEASPDAEYHELRLTFKRFRYILEFFNDLFAGKQYKTLYKQAKRLQTLLGDFQDITVQKSAVHDFAEELSGLKSVTHETFMALGQVSGEFVEQHDDLKHQFHLKFSEFSDEKHQHMIANLKKAVL